MRKAEWFEACLLLSLCVAGCSSEESPTAPDAGGAAGVGLAATGGSSTTAGWAGASANGGVAGLVGTGGSSGEPPGSGGSSGGAAATGGIGVAGGMTGGSGTGGAAGASVIGGTAGASGAGATAGAAGTTAGGGSGATGGGGTGGASSGGCGKAAGLTSGRASIDVDGAMREYILLLPDDYDSSRPYRLIFAWHQLAGSAESIANRGYYGLRDVSAGEAILVAPEGLVGNDNGDRGWWNNGGEDVDFYRAMLERFGSELCIDQERIFSTGFSFGAMFSFTLACTPDSKIRAIAPQAGSAFGGCGNGTRPVAVLGFVGTDDSLLSGHRQAVNTFGERNGCSGEPVELSMSWCDGLDSNNQPCVCTEHPNCDQGYPVIACEYQAGHTFAPDSGSTIWDFFSQF
jgi:polyhydroxybutyrate depolymerase